MDWKAAGEVEVLVPVLVPNPLPLGPADHERGELRGVPDQVLPGQLERASNSTIPIHMPTTGGWISERDGHP
jgi:hypothetical protein